MLYPVTLVCYFHRVISDQIKDECSNDDVVIVVGSDYCNEKKRAVSTCQGKYFATECYFLYIEAITKAPETFTILFKDLVYKIHTKNTKTEESGKAIGILSKDTTKIVSKFIISSI